MFNISDYVVCPGHGVGQVSSIESKEIAGEEHSYYIVTVISNGMKVMVPVTSKDGIRSLVDEGEVQEVFNLLSNHDVKVDNSTWNRRYREYMGKVKTGSLIEIADVLRSLLLLRLKKKLSFGERKMVDLCKDLLVKEIAITKGQQEKEVSGEIENCF